MTVYKLIHNKLWENYFKVPILFENRLQSFLEIEPHISVLNCEDKSSENKIKSCEFFLIQMANYSKSKTRQKRLKSPKRSFYNKQQNEL